MIDKQCQTVANICISVNEFMCQNDLKTKQLSENVSKTNNIENRIELQWAVKYKWNRKRNNSKINNEKRLDHI